MAPQRPKPTVFNSNAGLSLAVCSQWTELLFRSLGGSQPQAPGPWSLLPEPFLRGPRGEAGRSAVHSRLFFALVWLRRPQARARSLRLLRGDLPGADNQTLSRTLRRATPAI